MTVHPKHDSGTFEYRGKEVPTPSVPLSEAQGQCGEGRSVTIPLPGWRWPASWAALHTSWHLWFNQAPLIPPSIKAQHRNHKLPQPLTGIVWLKPRGTLWKVISVLWIQGPLILLPGFKWSQEILQQGGKQKSSSKSSFHWAFCLLSSCAVAWERIFLSMVRGGWVVERLFTHSFIQAHALCQAPLLSMGCANFIGHSFIFHISMSDTKLGPMVLSLLFSGGGTS